MTFKTKDMKTYKKATADIKKVLKKWSEYKDFETTWKDDYMIIRDPRGYSFGFPYSECPVFYFDIQPSQDGTELKDGSGGYKMYLKPDDYKPSRGKPWILGEWWHGPN